MKKQTFLASFAIVGLLAVGHMAKAESAQQETLFLVNESTQEVIEVSQGGKIEPVADPLEIQALEEKLNLAAQDQAADLRGIGGGISLGRGGIGGGIRIGPIGGGIRIGRDGIRVGGRAGRAGAGARVGRGGVRAGGHVGRARAGGSVSRRGVRAGARASFWDGGQWEHGTYTKETGRFSGQWTPVAVGI